MRFRSTLNREVAGKRFHKWIVADVPREAAERLGWSEGDALDYKVVAGTLVLRPTQNPVRAR